MATAMPEKKQKGSKKKKDQFAMTWMDPVALPATSPGNAPPPAPENLPVAPVQQPPKVQPSKFQWKQPTRGWHNGVPPGMAAAPPQPPQARSPTPTLPEKRPAEGTSRASVSSPTQRRKEEVRDRSCMGQGFYIDDWLCGAAALCTQRPGGPNPATSIPGNTGPGGLVGTAQQAFLHVEAAKVPTGCGGDCFTGRGPSAYSAQYVSTPTLDDSTLDELMLVEEEGGKGGLWKLVTDLFAIPGQQQQHQPGPQTPSHVVVAPPTSISPNRPIPPNAKDMHRSPGAPPLGGSFRAPHERVVAPFVFQPAQEITPPPEDVAHVALLLDDVVNETHWPGFEGDKGQPPLTHLFHLEQLQEQALSTGTSPSDHSFSVNEFSSAGDVASTQGHETGNGNGSERADSIDGTTDMDTMEVKDDPTPSPPANRAHMRLSPTPTLRHRTAGTLHAPPAARFGHPPTLPTAALAPHCSPPFPRLHTVSPFPPAPLLPPLFPASTASPFPPAPLLPLLLRLQKRALTCARHPLVSLAGDEPLRGCPARREQARRSALRRRLQQRAECIQSQLDHR